MSGEWTKLAGPETYPDAFTTVLLWGSDWAIGFWDGTAWFAQDGDIAMFGVTHWMDLPDEPEA